MAAREQFTNHSHAGARRLVVILTDQTVNQNEDEAKRLTKILLGMCQNPPRVAAFRLSDFPNDDPDCNLLPRLELLKDLANTIDSRNFNRES